MTRRQRIRCVYFLFLPIAGCNAVAWAAADVCQEPAEHPEVFLELSNHGSAGIDPEPGRTRQQRRNFDVLARFDSTSWSFGAGHRYAIFNFSEIELQTNAHLHTSFIPVHWLQQKDQRSFRLSFAPAISASSNVMRNLQEHRSSAIQWLVALAWRRDLSDRVTLTYGLCGDHRFGAYRMYPLAAVEWTPHVDWLLELGFPTSRMRYRLTDGLTSELRIEPIGNEWYVMNRNRTESSQFIYQAYAADWNLEWQLLRRLSVSASLGTHLRGRYDLTLLDGEKLRRSAESAFNVGAGLRWRF